MTTTTNSIESILTSDIRSKLIEIVRTDAARAMSIGELRELFSSNPQAQALLIELDRITLTDLVTALTAVPAKKESKPTVDVPPIQSFRDEAVRADWKKEALAFLQQGQLGERRGFAPMAIRQAVGSGNESQGRELIHEMEAAGLIFPTGGTKGKRYVVMALKSKAEDAFLAEKAEKEAAEEAAKAAKAAKEAAKAAEGK